ncbi:hypothetical protein BC834DRAFT_974104 [Gloeopeniophorella convolvens]|nr:hypothetical protein BC834DRAFT_974104 [Gloeopeniophorella convolvens]
MVASAEDCITCNTGYGNYNSDCSADKARELLAKNYERMQRVKTEYDAAAMFTKWFMAQPSVMA